MPVPIESIQIFLLSHGDIAGIVDHSSDILAKAEQEADSDGMVPCSKFTKMLGRKATQTFMGEIFTNTKHQEILSKTVARANRKK
ncbi:MAG: hypothetical protein U9Q72_01015 [Patescibacteria group bacterium]|nr:hypothetical protein [Patescibacteria group bacterium]